MGSFVEFELVGRLSRGADAQLVWSGLVWSSGVGVSREGVRVASGEFYLILESSKLCRER